MPEPNNSRGSSLKTGVVMTEIFCANCFDFMSDACRDGRKWDIVFADPPDNIGLGYDGYSDKMSRDAYDQFCIDFVSAAMAVANHGVWVSFNARNMLSMFSAFSHANSNGSLHLQPCVQRITFGNQRNKPGLTNNYRPLWFISHGEPVWREVREASWRQLNGDKRANPAGKIVSDVFDFPRVTGNSAQRRKWHPTQLHEGLVERCILLTTDKAGTALDIFAGTGTTARACKNTGRVATLVDMSSKYCSILEKELAI